MSSIDNEILDRAHRGRNDLFPSGDGGFSGNRADLLASRTCVRRVYVRWQQISDKQRVYSSRVDLENEWKTSRGGIVARCG